MRQMTQLETWRGSRATPAMLNMPHLIMSLTFYSLCRTFAFAAMLLPLAAQPKVGFVEVYGARKLPKDRILRTIEAGPGSALPRSKGEMEEKLVALDGVALAQMEAFCCEEGRLILYVGIQERGMPLFEYRPTPSEDVFLPAEVSQAYTEFTAALGRAAAAGDECLNDIFVLGDPSREIDDLPFADGVFLTVADANTQKSYWITPDELRSVRASSPSDPAPDGYGFASFPWKMTVQGGMIVKFEQVWVP